MLWDHDFGQVSHDSRATFAVQVALCHDRDIPTFREYLDQI
jgi:hypothetical protein